MFPGLAKTLLANGCLHCERDYPTGRLRVRHCEAGNWHGQDYCVVELPMALVLRNLPGPVSPGWDGLLQKDQSFFWVSVPSCGLAEYRYTVGRSRYTSDILTRPRSFVGIANFCYGKSHRHAKLVVASEAEGLKASQQKSTTEGAHLMRCISTSS